MFYTRPDHQGCPQCQFTVVQDRRSSPRGVQFLLELLQHFNSYMEENVLSGYNKYHFTNTQKGIISAQGTNYFVVFVKMILF